VAVAAAVRALLVLLQLLEFLESAVMDQRHQLQVHQ
jgi:hypothetical protein